VENQRDSRTPRFVENFRDPRDPRPVENLIDPRPVDPRITDLSRAVSALGARAPFSATCLEQSLALVMLLSIARVPAHLVVGVGRAESTFRAHAWVECGGAVVLGAAQARGLTPLPRTPAPESPSTVLSSCPG
jgi:hypothetical protein